MALNRRTELSKGFIVRGTHYTKVTRMLKRMLQKKVPEGLFIKQLIIF
jgi:hypothetical protein